MKDYILGEKIISTTPEKYESTFKAMGYMPLKKQPKKEEKKVEEVKIEKTLKKEKKED